MQIVAKLSKIKCHKNLFKCFQVVKCVEIQWGDKVIKEAFHRAKTHVKRICNQDSIGNSVLCNNRRDNTGELSKRTICQGCITLLLIGHKSVIAPKPDGK